MSDEIPQDKSSLPALITCPNCKEPIATKARYCMACGHQMRYLLISNKALRMGPFPLYMIVIAVLVVPFGAVGACSLGFTVKGPDALNFPFFIICGSLGIAGLMALVNFIKGTRKRP